MACIEALRPAQQRTGHVAELISVQIGCDEDFFSSNWDAVVMILFKFVTRKRRW